MLYWFSCLFFMCIDENTSELDCRNNSVFCYIDWRSLLRLDAYFMRCGSFSQIPRSIACLLPEAPAVTVTFISKQWAIVATAICKSKKTKWFMNGLWFPRLLFFFFFKVGAEMIITNLIRDCVVFKCYTRSTALLAMNTCWLGYLDLLLL